ncbi:MAG TPA: DUF3014 domain-containing protein, partial [Albitalea sp.]
APAPAAPVAQPASEPPPAVAAASPPAIRHPIEAVGPSATPEEPVTSENTLTQLFGRKTVLAMFQLDDFPRRFVATVDNLARVHAPAQLWPVNPPEGRFTVQQSDGREAISPDNGLRYTPYVLLLETVDLRQVVEAYRALYPQLQQAYEELGYPKAYFNDRLVDVIDHLLATPEPSGPIAVQMTEIKGPVRPERPWVLYQFSDPWLESLSSGQKMLLRMGPVNERRVKSKLAELRRLVAADPAPR